MWTWLIFQNYILPRSDLTVLQVHNIWLDDLTGGTDILFKFLICLCLARCDQMDSGWPDGHISGHLWEYLARSCLDQFGDDCLWVLELWPSSALSLRSWWICQLNQAYWERIPLPGVLVCCGHSLLLGVTRSGFLCLQLPVDC